MQETRDSDYFGLGFTFSIISILLNCWGAGEPVWVCACEDWTLCRCTRCSTKHTGLQVIYLSGVRFFLGGGGRIWENLSSSGNSRSSKVLNYVPKSQLVSFFPIRDLNLSKHHLKWWLHPPLGHHSLYSEVLGGPSGFYTDESLWRLYFVLCIWCVWQPRVCTRAHMHVEAKGIGVFFDDFSYYTLIKATSIVEPRTCPFG